MAVADAAVPFPAATVAPVVPVAPPVAADTGRATTDGWGWTAVWDAEEEAERLRAELREHRDLRKPRERSKRRFPTRSFLLVLVFASGSAGAALAIPRAPAPVIRPAAAPVALTGSPAPSAYATRTIPAAYLDLYRRAGVEYGLDWTIPWRRSGRSNRTMGVASSRASRVAPMPWARPAPRSSSPRRGSGSV